MRHRNIRVRLRRLDIPLVAKDGEVRGWTTVDGRDADVRRRRWCLYAGYAGRWSPEGNVYLHREIMGLSRGDGLEVDHVNGDRLDNRRANLRVCTHAENHQNKTAHAGARSAHRGVAFNKTIGAWVAGVTIAGKKRNLGSFATEELAARAAAEYRRLHMPFFNENRS